MKRGVKPNIEETEIAAIQVLSDYQCNEALVNQAHTVYLRDFGQFQK